MIGDQLTFLIVLARSGRFALLSIKHSGCSEPHLPPTAGTSQGDLPHQLPQCPSHKCPDVC